MVCLHHAKRGGGGLRRSRKTEGVAVAVATHAVCAACGECIEIVEITRELREALEELVQALRVSDVGFVLQGDMDVAQAQYLLAAVVEEDLHGVFEEADAAFEFRAVFGPVGVGFKFFGISNPAHHHAQPVAHEFAGPRDRVEREEDAQEDEKHLTHGWEYNPAPRRHRFWEAPSYSLGVQVIEIMWDGNSLSYSFDPPLSPNSGIVGCINDAPGRAPAARCIVDAPYELSPILASLADASPA